MIEALLPAGPSVIGFAAPWIALLLAGALAGSAGGLLGIGVLGFAVYFLSLRGDTQQLASEMPGGVIRASLASGLGLISSLLGIGGGTITNVTMTLCGSPIHRAIGTASGMGAIIAVPASIGFVIIGWGKQGLPVGSLGFVNLPAAAAVIATSVLLAPLGVAAAHCLSPVLLRRVFGLYLIFVGVTMIWKS